MLRARPFLWSSTFLRLLLKIHSDLFHSRFIIPLFPSSFTFFFRLLFVLSASPREIDDETRQRPWSQESVPIRLQQVVGKRVKKFPYPRAILVTNSLKIFLVLFQLFLIVSYRSSSPSFLSVCLSIVRLSKKKKSISRDKTRDQKTSKGQSENRTMLTLGVRIKVKTLVRSFDRRWETFIYLIPQIR